MPGWRAIISAEASFSDLAFDVDWPRRQDRSGFRPADPVVTPPVFVMLPV